VTSDSPEVGASRAVRYEATGWYRVHVPQGVASPAAALLAVHGYGQDPGEMFAYARKVAPAGTIVIAPEGPLSWYRKPGGAGGAAAGGVGFGWTADPRRDEADARNTRLLEAVWADANAAHPLDPRRTAVLGFSQGVGVALAWLLDHPDRAASFVALAGGLRVPLRPRLPALRGLAALWVTGASDAAYPGVYAAELLTALTAAGLDVSHVELSGGHGVPEPAADHVRGWLERRLASSVAP
jgi:phospholipase/carboxylesterase